MYAKNITTFLLHLIKDSGDGSVRIDPADEITRDTLMTQKGEVVNPRIRELLGLPGLVQAGA
jgi:NAD(P) transhydrogenase subunit alpha